MNDEGRTDQPEAEMWAAAVGGGRREQMARYGRARLQRLWRSHCGQADI